MKRYFLTGLATLLPLAITVYVIEFLVNFLTRPFLGIVLHILEKFQFFGVVPLPVARLISQLLIILIIFGFILFLGAVARGFFIKSLIWIADWMFKKIPFLNKVYKTSKDITEILFSSKKKSFKQVVMVRFPNKNCYSLGLIASDAPDTIAKLSPDQFVSVFLPTTPNPTTGFLIVSPKSELILLDMKSDEAIKYILSCGVIQPKREKS
ncbi:MAG TPA: DUF502 domain-containing protein [Chlamydiales bacterium]|jgi:uncharacterized membrane protein|nr:DUF502 domain-containing protein [Chlamydiales bacterium]